MIVPARTSTLSTSMVASGIDGPSGTFDLGTRPLHVFETTVEPHDPVRVQQRSERELERACIEGIGELNGAGEEARRGQSASEARALEVGAGHDVGAHAASALTPTRLSSSRA